MEAGLTSGDADRLLRSRRGRAGTAGPRQQADSSSAQAKLGSVSCPSGPLGAPDHGLRPEPPSGAQAACCRLLAALLPASGSSCGSCGSARSAYVRGAAEAEGALIQLTLEALDVSANAACSRYVNHAQLPPPPRRRPRRRRPRPRRRSPIDPSNPAARRDHTR